MPAISQSSPRCMAGMTLTVAIRATPRMPQRTFFIEQILSRVRVRRVYGLISVPAGRGADFAAEHSIDEDEIADRDRHSEAPPDEADGQRVLAGMGVVDGDVQ